MSHEKKNLLFMNTISKNILTNFNICFINIKEEKPSNLFCSIGVSWRLLGPMLKISLGGLLDPIDCIGVVIGVIKLIYIHCFLLISFLYASSSIITIC